jgi:ubiquinone biosynthesis protein UbiJ
MLKADLANHIGALVNRVLALDPETLAALVKYAGSIIAIDLHNTNTSVYVSITESGIQLTGQTEREPDVRISGTPLRLVSYLAAMKQNEPVTSGIFQISGNIALAQAVQSLLRNLDLDWEEELSRWVGDTIAHKTGNTARHAATTLKQAGITIGMDISEYLRYETELLPDRSAVEAFNASIDVLRDDVERLKMRLRRLQQSHGLTS